MDRVPKAGDFRHSKPSLVAHDDKNSLGSNFVQTIHEQDKSTIWIGMRNGLDKVAFDNNFQNPTVEHLIGNGENFDLLSNSYVLALYKDAKGRLWIGTMYTGLFMYTEENGILERFSNSDKENSLSSNSIRSINQDQKGRIWLGWTFWLSIQKNHIVD